MSDVKTSAETAASALSGTELIRIVQGGVNVRTTTAGIAKLRLLIHAYPYSATVTVDTGAYDVADVTLTGPMTLAFSNGVDGRETIVRLRQDGTGGRLLTLDGAVRLSTDIPSVTLSATASYLDYVAVRYCSADSKYDLIAYNRGFH